MYRMKSFRDVCAVVYHMVLGHKSHTYPLEFMELLERSY